MGDVVVMSCLGQRGYKMGQFSVISEVRRELSKTVTLDFWRGDYIGH